MLRDATISLSLANLCFVKVWGRTLSGAGSYFSEFSGTYTSLVLDVLVLAGLFFVAATIVRLCRKQSLLKLARGGFLLVAMTIVNGAVSLTVTLSRINFQSLLGRSVVYVATVGFAVCLILICLYFQDQILRFGPRIALILLPFVVVTFSQSLWRLTEEPTVAHAEHKEVPEVAESHKPATRVVWIIFDEMDQRVSFDGRPSGLELPELDRLLSQSVFAANAYPPSPLTYMSMPALIDGRLVAQVNPVASDQLMVKFDGEDRLVPWNTQPNVFSRARRLGFSTAVAGWCHPYCEVLGSSLSRCDDVRGKSNDEVTLKASMILQFQRLIATIPLVPQIAVPAIQRVGFINQFVTSGERQKYTARYKRVFDASLKAATDAKLDLVFVHYPIPHPPGIYDRLKNDFSLQSGTGYIDNLKLVDRTIGELRQELEVSGLWESTTLIISADHWWRTEMWRAGPFWTPQDEAIAADKMDHRVPFIVKLAGQHDQLTYTNTFNTVVTQELVLSLMKGDVVDSNGVANWLDKHRSISDSPYNRAELLP
jgi:sulfatase-like protein